MPDTLYHYTSAHGLEGIIKRKAVWATDLRFFNDLKEFTYTLDLAHELSWQRMKLSNEVEQKFLWELPLKVSEIAEPSFCAFSLSTIGDLLSQWRGYCSNGGYSLGFSASGLDLHLQHQGFTLEQCDYDLDSQRSKINQLLDRALSHFRSIHANESSLLQSIDKVAPGFTRALSRIAATLKHHSFSEEKEWRLISNGPITSDALKYRIKDSIAVPYFELNLQDESGLGFPLTEIIVGPGPNQQLAIEGLKVLLQNHKIRDLSAITPSNIPYRLL